MLSAVIACRTSTYDETAEDRPGRDLDIEGLAGRTTVNCPGMPPRVFSGMPIRVSPVPKGHRL